jgi:hypothetical protein
MCLSRFTETNEHKNIRLFQQHEGTLQLRDKTAKVDRPDLLLNKQVQKQFSRMKVLRKDKPDLLLIEKEIQILGAMKV